MGNEEFQDIKKCLRGFSISFPLFKEGRGEIFLL